MVASLIKRAPSHRLLTLQGSTGTTCASANRVDFVLTLHPSGCFRASLNKESIVSLLDDGYSSLARDVSEHYIYLTSQSLVHPEDCLLYCYATRHDVPEANCSVCHLQEAPDSTTVTV
jgi:hypothetical protein